MIVDVIIPVLNEERSIGFVLDEIPRKLVRRILVCDNGSKDDTRNVAKNKGATVIANSKRGYGSACLSGINYIKDSPLSLPDIVVFIDGDYSDYPEEMTRLVAEIEKGNDMVIGSRALGHAEQGSMTPVQIFGNWLSTNLIRVIFKYNFTDLGPFRAIKWLRLVEMNMEDKDFGWTVEMQVKAAKMKLICSEVPVKYRKRIGESKVSGTIKGSILAGHKILWTIFKLI